MKTSSDQQAQECLLVGQQWRNVAPDVKSHPVRQRSGQLSVCCHFPLLCDTVPHEPNLKKTSWWICVHVLQCVKTDSPTSLQGLSRSDVSAAVTNKVQIHELLSCSYFKYIWNFFVRNFSGICTTAFITCGGIAACPLSCRYSHQSISCHQASSLD